jgi:predicted NBD/HSP70 family sugar kinase
MLTIPSITAQVSAALGRVVDYDEVLSLAADGEPESARVMAAAGRALGRLIAVVANLAMVEHVVLSGEGLGMLDVCGPEVDAALLADRDPDAAPVNVLVDDSGFIRWAQGAASIAIQATLDGLATTA